MQRIRVVYHRILLITTSFYIFDVWWIERDKISIWWTEKHRVDQEQSHFYAINCSFYFLSINKFPTSHSSIAKPTNNHQKYHYHMLKSVLVLRRARARHSIQSLFRFSHCFGHMINGLKINIDLFIDFHGHTSMKSTLEIVYYWRNAASFFQFVIFQRQTKMNFWVEFQQKLNKFVRSRSARFILDRAWPSFEAKCS